MLFLLPFFFLVPLSPHHPVPQPSATLTRQETMRWLMTTAATAHQRCFSQASKKTTPQNM